MFVNKLGYSVSGNSPLHMFVFSEKPVLCPWRAPIQSSCPRQNLASGFHIDRLFSSQAAEDREEALHSIIGSTETVQGSVSKHEFQAETKKLLDIVARSLYSEKEVFIRELISNASDALEKLRHKLVSEGQTLPEMEIHLQADAEKGTITIQDTGIGMTQEELVSNLGTIARSGSKAFLDALQNQAEASSKIIGQFGVGFYSAFMVADRVEVYSRSASPGSPGYQWLSDGSGVFEIAEASGVRTGTKIIIHLKSDCKEFASEARVRGAWSLGFWRRVTGSTESARHLMLCVLGDLVWVGVFGGRRQSWGVLGVFLGLAAQAH